MGNIMNKLIIAVLLTFCLSCVETDQDDRPISVDTPLLARMYEWPASSIEIVKQADENQEPWGQCRDCGFPVTQTHVDKDWGLAFNQYQEFYCYRHMDFEVSNEN